MNRYSKISLLINNNELYKNFFQDRYVKQINQYATIEYKYPSEEQLNSLEFDNYIWKIGDKYWKLAQKYYNDPTYWWVIGFINKKPIDSDVQVGDVIYVPLDIESVITILEG